jgi:2'-5' RNA ligase
LLEGYLRHAHITLSLCGFPSKSPLDSDEFGPEALAAQVQALHQAGVAPFDIAVGGLDTFSSVPYCAVSGGAAPLLALRRALHSPMGGATQGDYTPHVTVGLYRDAFPMPMVRERLQGFGTPEPLRVRVTGVDLLTYASAEIGGALRCRARFSFGGTELQWQDDLFA